MDKITLKKKILETSIKKNQALIDDFRGRIKELEESEGKVNEEEVDIQDQSYTEEGAKYIERLNSQLNFATEKQSTLYNLQGDNLRHKEALLGAIVETDKGIFFISAGVEKFKVANRDVMGLSIQSPLFQAMAGKKKGDKFQYNKVNYTIKDIY